MRELVHLAREDLPQTAGLRLRRAIGLLLIILKVVLAIALWPLRLLARLLRSGYSRTSDGYVMYDSGDGRPQYVHRLVAEEILSRDLKPGEVVHHINGRPNDNRVENLCVLSDRAHNQYHDWYDWIREHYGVFPRRETQLRKLKDLGGIILSEVD
jgi:hypothetical protein